MVRSKHDIVLLYGPPWDGPTQFSKHHLVRYLAARGNRVLYVEAPLGPLTLMRRPRAAILGLRSTVGPPRAVAPNVWVTRHFNPVPFHGISPLTSRRAYNVLGQRLLAPRIVAAMRRLGFTRPILVAGLPHAVDLLHAIPHRCLVYHCADDYAYVRGFPATLAELEKELCRRADLVIATAQTLFESRAAYNPRTYWIPNGVDVEHFARPVLPADDLRNPGRSVVGYVGSIADWLNINLVRHLALRRPKWLFALVGPISRNVSNVRELPNVRLLGPRPYSVVPRYLAAMDVALIPFEQDRVTWNADPIKAYEYLAAGVPVVASDLPALRRMGHVIRLADSPDAFVAHLDAAVDQGRDAGRAERQAEAARHGWTSRFERFEELLEERLSA
jgi:glycosyltransferase involved in cell wall biosynthesis